MKFYTESQVDDLIKLKFGRLVESLPDTSYVSNRVLGKLFGCSSAKIRTLYLARFAAIEARKLPLLQ